ncbi:hypothetical protein HAX54_024195, partial [Datura stramonium]|nr:hypothetical protein [Datura stramonium]
RRISVEAVAQHYSFMTSNTGGGRRSTSSLFIITSNTSGGRCSTSSLLILTSNIDGGRRSTHLFRTSNTDGGQ